MIDEENQQPKGPQRPPRKKRLRWGRIVLLLMVLAVVVTSIFWGTVWVYHTFINPTKVDVVASNSAIGTDEVLNKRINVLVLGTDDGDSEAEADEPKRTDAILIASFDPEKNEVSLLSIPRDTKVILPGHSSWEKANAAYAYGGVTMAKQTMANLLRIPIHYYVLADWEGFIKVIDLIGGVDLYVEKDMKYEDPYADLVIDIKQGYQHLDGKKAGEYVRFRNDELGDIGRVQRQQRFLKALAMQMFSLQNIAKIPAIFTTIGDYVQTDMTTLTILRAINSFKILDGNKVKSGMLYGDFDDETGISYWRTNRTLVEESLREVDIPFFDKPDGLTQDPLAGSEYAPIYNIPPKSNADEDDKKEDDKKVEEKASSDEKTTTEKSSSSSTTTEKPTISNTPTPSAVPKPSTSPSTNTNTAPSNNTAPSTSTNKPASSGNTSTSKPVISNKPTNATR